jgi:hypothetical protein
MFSKLFILLSFLGAAFAPLCAAAQVAELRLGVSQFDEEIIDFDTDRFGRADETSIAISGEVLFEEPEFLKWAFSPQPYIGGSINLEGKTSFGGGGLLWRQTFGKKVYGDFAAGVVIHDGTKNIELSEEGQALRLQIRQFENFEDVPMDLLDALGAEVDERFAREGEEIEFGSRLLFRLQGAVGYNFNDDWSGEIYLEHLSNGSGNVLDGETNGGVNEGVNILGLRAARKF